MPVLRKTSDCGMTVKDIRECDIACHRSRVWQPDQLHGTNYTLLGSHFLPRSALLKTGIGVGRIDLFGLSAGSW